MATLTRPQAVWSLHAAGAATELGRQQVLDKTAVTKIITTVDADQNAMVGWLRQMWWHW